jgi:hypothetical protein
MSDEVEDVFFKVGTRAGYQMDFVLTDHFSQRQTQFRCTHSAGEADHHPAALVEMGYVTFRCINQSRRVKMAVVMIDELE